MEEQIPYPKNTRDWGKNLIDLLRKRFDTLDTRMNTMTDTINTNTNTKIDEIKTDIEEIKQKAKDALELAQENKLAIDTMRCELGNQIELLKFTCEKLTSENAVLKESTNNLENYSRRDNIIFSGIPEVNNERRDDVEKKARTFMIEHLKLDETFVNNINIVRCHRLGAMNTKHHRPIIVRFTHYKDRMRVWEARKKITNRRVHISENFSAQTDYRRNKLYAVYKKAKSMREYHAKITLIGDVLVIDSKRYTVENLSELPTNLAPRQFGEKHKDNHVGFGGLHSNFSPFSNWYSCKIPYMGYSFANSEQAYQYSKAIYCDDNGAATHIRYTTDPKAAKELGLKVTGLANTDWENEKSDIMYEILKIKFKNNDELKQELLNTQDRQLVECGFDKYWATGISLNSDDVFDSSKWTGSNKLGQILCQIRSELK